jgi:hypothetical protein
MGSALLEVGSPGATVVASPEEARSEQAQVREKMIIGIFYGYEFLNLIGILLLRRFGLITIHYVQA